MATLEKKLSLWVFIFGIIGFVSIARTVFLLWDNYLPDFHVFYFSAFDLIHHINPYTDKELYTGLGYPLSTVVFYAPLLLFPFSIASKVFSLANVFFLFYSVYLSIKIIKKKASWNYFIFFASLAVFSALKEGSKLNLLMLFLSYVLVSFNIKQPAQFQSVYILLLSHVFYGTLILLYMVGKRGLVK